MTRWHPTAGLVAVAVVASAGAHAADAAALLRIATGSARDFTLTERQDAVRLLARAAGDGDDDAARALVSLLGTDLDATVLRALNDVRVPALTRALQARLAHTPLDAPADKHADTHTDVEQLCRLLAQSGDPAVVPAIQRVVDDGATKELRVAALRTLAGLGPSFGQPAAGKQAEAVDAATRALVSYVDHPALGAAARDVLLHMDASALPLRPLLQHKDPAVRAFATRALRGSGAPGLADALVRELGEASDDSGRAHALRNPPAALCGSGGSDKDPCDPQAQERLVDLVTPYLKHPELARAAVDALARVRSKKLVGPLVLALDHPSSTVRAESAALLARIGDPSAKPALQKKLQTTTLTNNWQELDAWLHAFVDLGVTVDDAPFVAAFLGRADIAHTSFAQNHKALWQQLARLPPSTSKVFIPLLRNDSREVRKSIALLLGRLGDPDAGVALLDVIDRHDEIGEDAARALGACADERSLPRMQRVLEARLAKEPWSGGGALAVAFVRADRAVGLEHTLSIVGRQGPLALELLRALLKETHPSDARAFTRAFAQTSADASTTYSFRWLAILGFGQIDTSQSIDTLCGIASGHDDGSVRRLAALALKRFPEPRAIGCMVTALQKATGTDRGGDRADIVRALEHATGQPLGDDTGAWRTFVDGGVGVRGGEASLVAALSHTSTAVRALAARQLGLQKKGLLPLLERLPLEREPEARLALLQAIAAHDDDRAKAPLVEELERHRAGWPERIALAKALDRLGDGRGTLVLLKLIDSGDADDAQRALLALSEVTGEPPTASPAFWRRWWKTHAERYRL